MAQNLSFRIGAEDDASAVFKKIASAAKKEMGTVGEELDDTQSKGKQLAQVLGAMADQMEVELKDAQQSAEALARALGPEMSAKLGQGGIDAVVMDMQRLGITSDDVEANVDELAASLKRLDDVAVSIDKPRDEMRKLGADTDQTRSVVANFAGNATQDMAGLTGVTGTAGMAMGQFAEYASEGNIKMSSLAKAAVPLALAAIAMKGMSDAAKKVAEIKAFETKRIEDYTDALKDGKSAADALVDVLTEAGKIEFTGVGDFISIDMTGALTRAGVSVQQFAELVAGGEEAISAYEQAMIAAGVPVETYGAVILAARDELSRFTPAQEAASAAAAFFGVELGEVEVAADGLALGVARAGDASVAAGSAMEGAMAGAKLGIDGAANATALLDQRWAALTGAIDADQAWLNLQTSFDDVKAKAEEAWRAAAEGSVDAEQKARDHQTAVNGLKSDIILYGQTILGLPPSRVTEILADIDEGSLDSAEAALDSLTKLRTAYVQVVTIGAGIGTAPGRPNKAAGGTTTAAQMVRVTEHGSELLHEGGNTYLLPGRDGRVEALGRGEFASGGSGLTVVIENVQVDYQHNGGSKIDPRQFGDAFTEAVRLGFLRLRL